jgi:AcrR family transcriptional regulator
MSNGLVRGGASRLEASASARGVGLDRSVGRERVIEIQRARILAAMVQESSERGAGNVTVAHVVARAGVSRRTFYELFEDREDCFLGAFDDAVSRVSRHVLQTYDPDAQWIERIRTSLGSLLSFLDVERGAGQLLIVGSLGAGYRALRRRQGCIAQIVALIDEGAREAKAGTELPPLTAEGIVGGVLSVLHARLLEDSDESLLVLTGPLMSMIVLPYLGRAGARKELARPAPMCPASTHRAEGNPFGELEMRLTYRTVRVLMAVAAHPGSSNRIVADAAEVTDQGQMSKLLARLHDIGLVENTGGGAARGEPNAWTLTDKGWHIQGAITQQTPNA